MEIKKRKQGENIEKKHSKIYRRIAIGPGVPGVAIATKPRRQSG